MKKQEYKIKLGDDTAKIWFTAYEKGKLKGFVNISIFKTEKDGALTFDKSYNNLRVVLTDNEYVIFEPNEKYTTKDGNEETFPHYILTKAFKVGLVKILKRLIFDVSPENVASTHNIKQAPTVENVPLKENFDL